MENISTWPGSAIAWMDDKGKGAWIGLMVISFVFAWPLGLAILFFLLWSKRMGRNCGKYKSVGKRFGLRNTQNSAFENYKSDTINRLREEQSEFEAFLDRLRKSKDKTEFDMFMEQHQSRTTDSQVS